MRRWAVAAIMIIFPTITSAAERKGESLDDVKAQIKALQKERTETLLRLVELDVRQYEMGVTTLEALVAAQNELVSAQLEATEKPEERVALLTDQLKIATACVKLTQGRFESGNITQADVYRATSHFLDIKIKLLRERSRLPTK